MVLATGPRKKLRKSNRTNPTALEDEVAQCLYDLEVNNINLRPSLLPLTFNAAKEVEVGNRRAIVIFYPLRFLRKFHKIQKQLVSELEKKFSGKHVILIAQRKMARKPKSNMQQVQRSRTLTAVHDAMLADIVFPCDIVGRRWRFKADGSKVNKVFLDAREQAKVESKLEAFATVFKKMSGKEASFGFMTNPLLQQFI
eukprot:NODE_2098_length_766_cov_1277.684798_g1687_i0.p1 GENE.NODE_2098_length_766_cov_1277.684798_g1687_i0~~NODE_2098_length_766_cov_1277.684798_g1687_i0.p1  ORF type:complete len:198 (-),score=52.86 NODE_2098_length_766_cov_1277.684798_g1687_i0:99-692(-)